MKYALVGAGGFFGSRFMETVILEDKDQVRALVRQPGSLARLARLGSFEHCLADALDSKALRQSVEGCDVMIHAMVGDPWQIVVAAQVAAQVAREIGIRLVYLSSASVHGQNPPLGTNEESPLSDRQSLPYNNAKVRAERAIIRSNASAAILRPGIVYGPRSQWTNSLMRALLEGRAYLVDGGVGICNHIYVDNLVQAVRIAAAHPRATEGPFYVADSEAKSWREFYQLLIEGWGHQMDEVWDVQAVGPPVSGLRERVVHFKGSSFADWLLPKLPRRLKDAARAAVDCYSAPDAVNGFVLPSQNPPVADFETSELHRCRTRLSMQKARSMLDFSPRINIDEAIKRLTAQRLPSPQ